MVYEWNQENFDEQLKEGSEPVLVDMYADWCGPCKMMAPVIEEIAGEYSGRLKVAKVNIDTAPALAERYKVMSIPTLIVFKNGELAAKIVGMRAKEEIEAELESVL
ncbi:thioredoxin [Ruminococcus sp. OA3]|uniref:thioredoxin n=1 Tax=Ruminococcus sp. OA3 TaxID=2914164 RepID=UPI001F05D011|nr:thioredoxin [Ruminococcus sp. OA3]MCH1981783.1 thioredoxin [Ruminococcus sp. OA3]